ncbi:MAG: hypothetical protein JJU26_10085 [Oceanicaulis sp.]|uniref:hypothetical protein n=1 Tax=Glycocaulis sp. TaxID=1969725 RepID=UPI0025C691AC|nr:hypothetical protein [Glycocaulis sp.]MCC5982053.1 hypothetical protein [Oceanicaulis sp.]MCH8522198.1 hypothetical protein [Glycocaulis sp.]
MAKAVFHKHQRVYVHPVGTWALIEKVKPQWVRDVEEPVKVFYDCGLGRDFQAHELAVEDSGGEQPGAHWRILRAANKWQTPEECAHHPFPGTYPVVVTDQQNWGGWRTPGAEYDRDPHRIEAQARLIAQAPRLLALAEAFARAVADNPECGPELVNLARQAGQTVKTVRARPGEPGQGSEDALHAAE